MYDDQQSGQSADQTQSAADNSTLGVSVGIGSNPPVPSVDMSGASPTTAPASAPGIPINPAAASPAADDLVQIKKQALDELSPLVHTLDQTPEEKYKTLMMMIQASDNQALVKTAYETAKKIPDEKARAEALLNIVNEINYFTQKG